MVKILKLASLEDVRKARDAFFAGKLALDEPFRASVPRRKGRRKLVKVALVQYGGYCPDCEDFHSDLRLEVLSKIRTEAPTGK